MSPSALSPTVNQTYPEKHFSNLSLILHLLEFFWSQVTEAKFKEKGEFVENRR